MIQILLSSLRVAKKACVALGKGWFPLGAVCRSDAKEFLFLYLVLLRARSAHETK